LSLDVWKEHQTLPFEWLSDLHEALQWITLNGPRTFDNVQVLCIAAYSLKARIVESQQLAVTRQQPLNNNRGMVLSAQFVPMDSHTTVEYIIPILSNGCTATEMWCFLYGSC
jgi:hypothetical protein